MIAMTRSASAQERAQIGRGIAEAQDARAGHVRPDQPDAPADHAHRHLAQAAGVEIAQIDDVGVHGTSVAWEGPLN